MGHSTTPKPLYYKLLYKFILYGGCVVLHRPETREEPFEIHVCLHSSRHVYAPAYITNNVHLRCESVFNIVRNIDTHMRNRENL